ncbi:ribosome-associated protein [Sphingobium sp. OAS761]|uniref:alternative ribosome rescue aminoacyl-tRNA hydrolase ArfB n=1 Tax=Sphingobium sp. OAS761 TaxID=2817901 RepID=UPI00209FBA29|nr:alternative ribosome rescue aminoacyl-tRNA hydrolase ArfB [Sphingobium sp. OAS761]MCP1470872.1 ribosome-associated protein [Sphingobium sp. OAS761]
MPPFDIPEDALEERFVTGGGPGGQNVNKVATTVQLRVNLFRLSLPLHAYRKIRELAGSRLTSANEILIQANRFRTQDANRQDARERLAEMIARAHERDARRIATRPGKAAKARRVDAKKARSNVKQGRGKVKLD